MSRGRKESFLWFRKIGMVILVLLQHQACDAITNSNNQTYCPPSSCGKITNIKYPFRLKNDPTTCGDPRYELSCENNMTTLSLFSGKYYVKEINYKNYTIRLVDPGIQEGNCSTIPRYFLTTSNFSSYYNYRYSYYRDPYIVSYEESFAGHIIYLNCSNPVKNNTMYVDTSQCVKWHSKGYIYAISGDIKIGSLNVGCRVKLVTMSSAASFNVIMPLASSFNTILQVLNDLQPLSYAEIHEMLSYGFNLSWIRGACEFFFCDDDHFCYFNRTLGYLTCSLLPRNPCSTPLGLQIKCGHLSKYRVLMEDIIVGIVKGLLQIAGTKKSSHLYAEVSDSKFGLELGRIAGRYLLPSFTVRFALGLLVFFLLLIYTYRRRHISIYENIEVFLRASTLIPIRYSYKDIKKMTGNFKDKLGEGGFGSVYKGKLRSGPFVAIKMLGKPKGNGQDFISEVATIGRIHHANVVRLVGFCVERSKRALVYEFMPNSSLDKYISSKEDFISLTSKKMYEISLGVARGITYLHQGCHMQILHFDIKPHNILLDDNFVPKVSDFGLAKLYPNDDSIVTLTAARGTIGYMAPELFYKNIGGVSYKADVYSFGMLLMEMASKRKNLNPHADRSSQLFYPFWIYNQLIEEREIEMDQITDEDKNNVKKMFIIALWCIQLKPSDRPAMTKVIEMLEGDIANIEMPPKPSLYPNELIQEDLNVNSYEIDESSHTSVGTLTGISGAMVLTFVKGVEIKMGSFHLNLLHHQNGVVSHTISTANTISGSLCALASSISYALWLIIQTKMSERYPTHYSSTALISFWASLVSIVLALYFERDLSQWKLGWNIRLLTVAYAGIVVSGAMVAVISWCVHMRGPLFASVFTPLMLLMVALAGCTILNEKLHLGSIIGAVLIVCGLYAVVWGKSKEMKKKNQLVPSKNPHEFDQVEIVVRSIEEDKSNLNNNNQMVKDNEDSQTDEHEQQSQEK